jgi:hypothetical protein
MYSWLVISHIFLCTIHWFICIIEGNILIITVITSRELCRYYGLGESNTDSGVKIWVYCYSNKEDNIKIIYNWIISNINSIDTIAIPKNYRK